MPADQLLLWSVALMCAAVGVAVGYLWGRARARRVAAVVSDTAASSAATGTATEAATAEAINRSLMDALADGIFVAQDHRFVFANASLPKMLGFAREDFVDVPFAAVVAPESLPEWLRRYDLRVGSGAEPARAYEVRFLVKGGPTIDLELVATRAAFRGRPAVVGLLRDVTERRALAGELDRYRHHLEQLVSDRTAELTLARDQAQQANRAKSAFLANISHEIRTPMNAILGLSHLAMHASADGVEHERLHHINDAAHHLLGLINGILDLSKIESGKFVLEDVDFAIDAVVERSIAMVSQAARDKSLALAMDIGGLPNTLKGDPTRLSQALVNLLGNAVKFTAAGSVSLRGTISASADEGHLLRFEVRDTGPGIAPDRLAHLFHAFEQGDSSTTREYGGTGLGLVITRHLARLMGGEADAVSTPGEGSTFWFTAKVRDPGEATAMVAPVTAPSTSSPATDLRVLLAEDNLINQEVARGLIELTGIVVDVAANGRAAAAMALDRDYALILMDMQMPELDGIEATRLIRAAAGGPRVPIIAMTANAYASDRTLCLQAGMDDFVSKPVDPRLLYDVMGKWLHRDLQAMRTARMAG